MPIRRDQLVNLLKNRDFRAQFVSDQPNEFLPLQIKRLRERRGWSQAELGEAARMRQERISVLESPDHGGINLNTLKRLARAFDVGLIVRFVPFSEFIDWVCTLSPGSFEPASFDEEVSSWSYRGEQGQFDETALSAENPSLYGATTNIIEFKVRERQLAAHAQWPSFDAFERRLPLTAASVESKGDGPSAFA